MLLNEVAPFVDKPETVDEVYEKLKRNKMITDLSRDGDWIRFKRGENQFLLKRRELFVIVDDREHRLRRFVDNALKVERAAIFVNQLGTHYPDAK